jgi:hypothetical protein
MCVIADIIPGLTQKYPNHEMEAELLASSPPTGTYSPSGGVINGPGQIIVSVIPPSGQPIPVFAINIAFSASATVYPHPAVRATRQAAACS